MSQIIINKDGYTLFKGFHVAMYINNVHILQGLGLV